MEICKKINIQRKKLVKNQKTRWKISENWATTCKKSLKIIENWVTGTDEWSKNHEKLSENWFKLGKKNCIKSLKIM